MLWRRAGLRGGHAGDFHAVPARIAVAALTPPRRDRVGGRAPNDPPHVAPSAPPHKPPPPPSTVVCREGRSPGDFRHHKACTCHMHVHLNYRSCDHDSYRSDSAAESHRSGDDGFALPNSRRWSRRSTGHRRFDRETASGTRDTGPGCATGRRRGRIHWGGSTAPPSQRVRESPGGPGGAIRHPQRIGMPTGPTDTDSTVTPQVSPAEGAPPHGNSHRRSRTVGRLFTEPRPDSAPSAESGPGGRSARQEGQGTCGER
jgi:hypothetical protein